MDLVASELSEPYSIFTYRYFIASWPGLCWMAYSGGKCVGAIVCKLDDHRGVFRGYIAMLVVAKTHRKYGIGTELVRRSLKVMREAGADECVLEAEECNRGALALYQHLGFIRDKYLVRYYLNGVNAFRLKLLLPQEVVDKHRAALPDEAKKRIEKAATDYEARLQKDEAAAADKEAETEAAVASETAANLEAFNRKSHGDAVAETAATAAAASAASAAAEAAARPAGLGGVGLGNGGLPSRGKE